MRFAGVQESEKESTETQQVHDETQQVKQELAEKNEEDQQEEHKEEQEQEKNEEGAKDEAEGEKSDSEGAKEREHEEAGTAEEGGESADWVEQHETTEFSSIDFRCFLEAQFVLILWPHCTRGSERGRGNVYSPARMQE